MCRTPTVISPPVLIFTFDRDPSTVRPLPLPTILRVMTLFLSFGPSLSLQGTPCPHLVVRFPVLNSPLLLSSPFPYTFPGHHPLLDHVDYPTTTCTHPTSDSTQFGPSYPFPSDTTENLRSPT